MKVCNGPDEAFLKARSPARHAGSAPTGLSPRWPALKTIIFGNASRAALFGVFVGFAAVPIARAAEPDPPFKPAISDEAATAVSQMGKTLLAKEQSITARTIRVYLGESGQPLHVFHTMKIVVRRPSRNRRRGCRRRRQAQSVLQRQGGLNLFPRQQRVRGDCRIRRYTVGTQ